jgi:hypothetical protein
MTPGGALGLGKLVEWLAGGERERGRELKVAAAMAGGATGMAARLACAGAGSHLKWMLEDDGALTTKMPPWYPSSVAARTAVTLPSDRRSVARSARMVRTRWRTASRGGVPGAWGARTWERSVSDGGT